MRVFNKMNWLGLVIWCTGCFRMHKDGDGFQSIFRWWHPMTWILMLILVPFCAIYGEPLLNVVPLDITDFWKKPENNVQLQWVTPFTKLDTLKDFRYNIKLDNNM